MEIDIQFLNSVSFSKISSMEIKIEFRKWKTQKATLTK